MDRDAIKIFLNKEIKINLKSSTFFYVGILKEVKENSVCLLDRKNSVVVIDLMDIAVAEMAEKK